VIRVCKRLCRINGLRALRKRKHSQHPCDIDFVETSPLKYKYQEVVAWNALEVLVAVNK
jgi:hypothetical protein